MHFVLSAQVDSFGRRLPRRLMRLSVARVTQLHSAQVPSIRPETTASPDFPGCGGWPGSAAGQHSGHGGHVGGGHVEVAVARMVA